MPHAPIDAVMFDAYGTLFNVHSVIERCEGEFPGHGEALSRLWRAKQLEFTWLRSLMGTYLDFESITGDALRTATRTLGLPLDDDATLRLMDEYLRLSPFPEVKSTLAKLPGRKLCILSNGTSRLLSAVVRHAGLDAVFDHVISVEPLRIYKPHPSVYQRGVDAAGIPKERIAFVSSNYWDVSGASAFGFRTYWINRSRAQPDELGQVPAAVLHSLDELPSALVE